MKSNMITRMITLCMCMVVVGFASEDKKTMVDIKDIKTTPSYQKAEVTKKLWHENQKIQPQNYDLADRFNSKEEYYNIVDKAKSYIKKGDIFQVVTSQRFETEYYLDAKTLYRSLRRLNPSPFLVNLNFDKIGLVASSPEILVRLRNNQVTIRPIAGTRKRGIDKEQDITLSKELLNDEKDDFVDDIKEEYSEIRENYYDNLLECKYKKLSDVRINRFQINWDDFIPKIPNKLNETLFFYN